MTTALTIASTSIRQDEHGRFCLNDLHKASGGAEKDKPKFWLENKQATEMQQVLLKGGIPPVKALQGRYGGTYAVKTMVYAYAMWVSADFHVAVIEAYDQMVTSGRVQPTRQPVEMTRMEILQLALDSEQKRLEAEAKLAIAAPKAEALDRLADVKDSKSITEAAKLLKFGPKKLVEFLLGIGWLYRRGVARSELKLKYLIHINRISGIT
ncbi:MAG: KilA-N domain-containing protein [Stenotrophomonas sp.]